MLAVTRVISCLFERAHRGDTTYVSSREGASRVIQTKGMTMYSQSDYSTPPSQ
jgi:hypothetical protein